MHAYVRFQVGEPGGQRVYPVPFIIVAKVVNESFT